VAVLPIVKYGNPILRKKLEPVKEITPEIQQIVDDMFETMHDVKGIGLAANQVGLDQQIIVLDGAAYYEECEKRALINPEIIEQSGEALMVEGCLSIPGVDGEVARFAEITVKGLDLEGKEVVIKAINMQARIFQHECDHLNGRMYIDRVSSPVRNLMDSKLKKLQKKTDSLK